MTTTTFKPPVSLSARGPGLLPLIGRLHGMLRRQASRRALARLDERLLADVGLTREQVRREIEKPFWIA